MDIKPKVKQDKDTKKWIAFHKTDKGETFEVKSSTIEGAVKKWHKNYGHIFGGKYKG